MPRNDNPNFKSHLSNPVTTVCHCIKITLTNGTVKAFTQHDEDVLVDGVSHLANVGANPSAVRLSIDMAVDNAQTDSVIDFLTFTEEQINNGDLDEAEVTLTMVNWSDPTQYYTLIQGNLGQIERGDNNFKAELRSTKDNLKVNTGRTYSSTCDAVLGDLRCTVDLATSEHRASTTVGTVVDNVLVTVPSGLSDYDSGWFANGSLVFTSGDNNGRSFVIRSDVKFGDEHRLELWQKSPIPIEVGDTFTITVGCNKSFDQCRRKFSNVVNYRGFPYIPTSDRINTYITKGVEVLDGGSLFN